MEGIACSCGRFVKFKPCQSDENRNKGCLIAVCNGPNAQGDSCGTIQWKKGASTSPSSSPPINASLPLLPTASQPPRPTESLPIWLQTVCDSVFAMDAPLGIQRCAKHGCGQSRLANDCQHRICRKRCRECECTSKMHTPISARASPYCSTKL